jgi:hypothetical protein
MQDEEQPSEPEIVTRFIGVNAVPIRMLEEYTLFGDASTAQDVLEFDFDYLPETYKLALAKLLIRSNEIPILFLGDIVKDLFEERENSIYSSKTPHEILIIYRRESTKDKRVEGERYKMSKAVDLAAPAVRNRRLTVINNLVKMGYDRVYTIDYVKGMVTNNAGIMNLPPSRITELVDESMKKAFDLKNKRQ